MYILKGWDETYYVLTFSYLFLAIDYTASTNDTKVISSSTDDDKSIKYPSKFIF